MAFLRLLDYLRQIRQDRLDEILLLDDRIRTDKESDVIEIVKSYLRHRYDCDKIFVNIKPFSLSAAFLIGDVISYSEPTFSDLTSYIIGDRVSYTITVNTIEYTYIYECVTNTVDELPTDTGFWIRLVENETLLYCIKDSTGNAYDDTEFFIQKDGRNSQIKQYCVSITLYELHKLINPRNVPDLRTSGRDEAIEDLKLIQKGRLTPDLPIYADTTQGEIISWGNTDSSAYHY